MAPTNFLYSRERVFRDTQRRVIYPDLIESLFDNIVVSLQLDNTIQQHESPPWFITNQKSSIMTSVIACCFSRTLHFVCRIFCLLELNLHSKQLAILFLREGCQNDIKDECAGSSLSSPIFSPCSVTRTLISTER